MSKQAADTHPTTQQREERARNQLLALARRIRLLRERKGLTQEDFASRCGISVSFASLLERGERSPSYETLVDMGQALEVSLSELLRDAPVESYDDPYYARLIDFACKSRLSRTQVDRLVAVGQAMLGVVEQPAESHAAPAHRRGGSGCTHEGCNRAVLARGMCASHYHRHRRARL